MLLIVNSADQILGHIEFFKTVNYLDEYELSYQVYGAEQRGKGVMTEAVNMFVRYLFETKQDESNQARHSSRQRRFPSAGGKMRLQARRHITRRMVQQGSAP